MKIKIMVYIISLLMSFNIYGNVGAVNKNAFWSQIQKGANIFNQTISREDIQAAKAYGIAFIRLAPDKFKTSKRDFLIGDADHYTGLVKEDLAKIKEILNLCAQEKMPVVITMLSLPGSRWKQNNQDNDDLRIWNNQNFQRQAAQFWKDLALELKDHPAIVGYNILNEPHPERIYDSQSLSINTINQEDVQNKLFDFYSLVIQHIRSVDKTVAIIVDSSAYADPKTFKLLKKIDDANVLYSFHMYEPYEYTNHKMNDKKYHYPGKISDAHWDKQMLKSYMNAVCEFQKKHHIPSNQILVGEFGGHRSHKGLPEYLSDLIEIFKENGWHFAFYAFREDTWDGMDYELGEAKLPWSYWQSLEKGEKPKLLRQANTRSFKVLSDALK